MPKNTEAVVVFPELKAELRCSTSEAGPLTSEEAKELIGWTEQPADSDDFSLRDVYSNKIKLSNNPTNRALKLPIAKRYALEFLRKVWHLNLETVVFGKSGEVRDGQHRIVGFILAEQQRSINPKKWGSGELTMEVLLGFGVSDDKETADSFDKGQSRSLDDVIYRHEDFEDNVSDNDQKKIARVLSGALRLVWLRCGGQTVSSAPHFPHSEALAFYKEHPGIFRSAKSIIKLDKGADKNEKLISSSISLAYATALYYLMGKVDEDKAKEFWSSFASGEGLTKGSPILALRSYLSKVTAGTGRERDALVGACVKAWLAFMAGETGTTKTITVKRQKDKKSDKMVLSEFPRIGGIDEEVTISESLTDKHFLVLSALKKAGKDVTYDEIVKATGLTKSNVSRLCGSDRHLNLEAEGLVKINQFEPEEGQKRSPLMVKITPKGLKQV